MTTEGTMTTDGADGRSKSSYGARRDSGRWPVSMEFPIPLKERLQAQAVKEQRSMAAVCRIAVEEYLDRNEE